MVPIDNSESRGGALDSNLKVEKEIERKQKGK
jgi:hypothetical protein